MVDNFAVPPKWILEPRDVNVSVGHSLSLQCRAEGHPTPAITWKRAIGTFSPHSIIKKYILQNVTNFYAFSLFAHLSLTQYVTHFLIFVSPLQACTRATTRTSFPPPEARPPSPTAPSDSTKSENRTRGIICARRETTWAPASPKSSSSKLTVSGSCRLYF
ncbi:Down syndrome cell adhesion molecule-like protein Dscam2 [Folsomia candida]|uniref:Down syndrome cell adhesion molecule-like protein Dscam2 n=1 Tax=Folsomia candida TaxID=158441 RepID=A0A226EGP3_FOLCA|nr:Down syndrome cell adhesion molecule-like protein Dscam2 [Folsomia candida]